MCSIRSVFCLLSVVLIVSCASSEKTVQEQKPATTDQEETITQLIADVPAADSTENKWLYRSLAETGTSGNRALIDMLTAPGAGDDTRARFAVNGLAKYVSRPDAEAQRQRFEQAVLLELQEGHSDPVNVFLMEQLELTGSNASVPVLQTFIGDDRLHESAVHALRAINTNQAKQTLLQGLPDTEGTQRATILKALGDMKADAAQEITPYLNDKQTRKAALYALARSGSPAAADPLAEAVAKQQPKALTYYLRYAERLVEENHNEQAAEISRDLLDENDDAHIRSAALSALAQAEGDKAVDELLDAATSTEPKLRFTALDILANNPDWDILDQRMVAIDKQPSSVQADIIRMLGRSGRGSVAELRPFLDSEETAVRLAAAQALATIGGEEALPELMEAMIEAEEPEEITKLKSILLQLPTAPLVTRAAEALPTASENKQVALIEILAARRATNHLDIALKLLEGDDPKIRMAVYRSLPGLATPDDLPQLIGLLPEAPTEDEQGAIQKAIVAVSKDIPESENRGRAVLQALEEAPAARKADLLAVLPKIGGKNALGAVVEASQHSDETVRDAALTALAGWQDASAIPPLLDAFKAASSSERGTIMDGYLRLVRQSKYSAEDKIQFLKGILAEANGTEEKTKIIATFPAIESPGALQAVARHFDDSDDAVREQALRSAAMLLASSSQNGSSDGAGKALAILEATTDTRTRKKIEQNVRDQKSDKQSQNTFTSLFNGEDLSGWTGDKDSYRVVNGQIVSVEGAAGNLFTEQEYSDFILKFEFKLTPGANNGLGIRSPLEGNPAYDAMELQIIDNTAEKYADLEPYQYHGSVYGVAPAERGYLNPPGEWNSQEVIADGSHITVKVNGHTILDTNIKEAAASGTMDDREHPGLFRESGHIGFLGHGDKVAFRNIRIRDLNVYLPDYSSGSDENNGMNEPPEGFKALFNGENLEGWKGLVGNPESRAKMSEEALAREQQAANAGMRKHWSVRDGVLVFDGKGHSLVTEKKYKDFEMLVDWKIESGGDSGIYLRGTPQVQIWDITEWPQGSGGLYNNKNHPRKPLVPADNSVGEWNHMRIKMVGEKVTVHLNDQLVVDHVTMENYWNRDKPIYSKGQIELQSHNTPLYFKNIFIREIPREEKLFNGEDLSGWERVGGENNQWQVRDGVLSPTGGSGWLSTVQPYDDFKLELEYLLPEGGNSGVFLRASREGNPAYKGIEIQLLDDYADEYANLEPWQYTGSMYDVQAPSRRVSKKAGEWQKMTIVADGPKIKVTLNGEIIINTSLVNFMDRVDKHPGLKRRAGYIGLQNHGSRVEFRDITITEIK